MAKESAEVRYSSLFEKEPMISAVQSVSDCAQISEGHAKTKKSSVVFFILFQHLTQSTIKYSLQAKSSGSPLPHQPSRLSSGSRCFQHELQLLAKPRTSTGFLLRVSFR